MIPKALIFSYCAKAPLIQLIRLGPLSKNNLPLSRCNSCNGIGPYSPIGLVTGIHISFLFQIFSQSKTLLRVLVLTIPISGLLGLYRPNYPNLGLSTGFWYNQLQLYDGLTYSVAQLDMDPDDNISHIFIAILSTVTSFQSPQQYTSIYVHPHICIDENFPTRYCSYNSCNTLTIRFFRFDPPGTTFVQISDGLSTGVICPVRLSFIATDSLIAQ